MKALGDLFRDSVNLNMFLVLPSAAFLALAGNEIVSLIYRYGAFDSLAADNTTLALLHYSYGLVGFAAVRVTAPIYYALGDSRLPMRISVATVVINMALYYPMIKLLDFAGLAAATSIAGLLNFALLLYFLPSKNVPFNMGAFLLNLSRTAVAAGLSVFLARMIPFDMTIGGSPILGRVANLILLLIVAGAMYLLLCFVFRVRELTLIRERLFRRKPRS